MPNHGPVGIFDSGVGGLSVLKEIRRLLPAEDLLYFADSFYCPYGERKKGEILARAIAITEFLLVRGAKLVVVASNTASTAALEELRRRFHVPVVGVEPAIKPAALATSNGRIGVLATEVTVNGERLSSLVGRFAEGVEVFTQPCPGLVELVEAGLVEGQEAEALLSRYLKPLLEKGVDTVVLGCTHYPFLRPLLERLAGSGLKVLETGEAVARQVVRLVQSLDLATLTPPPGREEYFTSGDPARVGPVIRQLLGLKDLRVEGVGWTKVRLRGSKGGGTEGQDRF